MVSILLLDLDSFYCRQVCKLINTHSQNYTCYDAASYKNPILIEPAVHQADYAFDSSINTQVNGSAAFSQYQFAPVDLSLLQIEWESLLVIYQPQQFFNPPPDAHVMVLMETPVGSTIQDEFHTPVSGIYKYCSLTSMLQKIQEFIQANPLAIPIMDSCNFVCVLGSACPTLRKKWIDDFIEKKRDEGRQIVRLDLCPPCFSLLPVGSCCGNNLSDAFLRLMADDLNFEEMGVFLSPDVNGTLCFRPFERADDLFECKPDHMRQFIELLRKWVIHNGSQYYVLIQCHAVPFSFIYAIAVLCDNIILINKEDRDLMNISYNKELGHLLANLPGSCDLSELTFLCPESERREGDV